MLVVVGQVLLVLLGAVHRLTAPRRRLLQLRARPALRPALLPHARHLLAPARVARQNDARYARLVAINHTPPRQHRQQSNYTA